MEEKHSNETIDNTPTQIGVIPRLIDEEMKASYLDYAMSVIVGRALPDVRDGLKPVHRRILYAMNDMGMQFGKPHKKCARIVGEVLGKYHPHGDTSVYDALVRMAQNFSLRYPLIDGQGNFGSVDGDSPAAMRYTEARMQKIAGEILHDIEKDTVNFADNFDASLQEPTVLPTKLPNLLINGSSGIAVGMATNIPPHNLSEIGKAIITTVDNQEITDHELLDIVQGPDFPTGAEICGVGGARQAYLSGKGKVIMRAIMHEEEKKGKLALIITEIPYMVNKAELVMQIADNVNDKRIEGIRDLRDESDRKGTRIVIELKQGVNPEVTKNLLYKHTRLQTTFGMNMIALVNNIPKLLTLKEILLHFIAHRKEVITRRTAFDLKKAEEKEHLLKGLVIALNNIDAVIALIKKSKTGLEAKEQLIARYTLSEQQAQAVLDMRLQRLTNLEQDKIKDELKKVQELITELKSILASEQKVRDIIKEETSELMLKYGGGRKTRIAEAIDDLEYADLIEPEDVVITISNTGYIKRIPLDTYKAQNRGGVGIRAAMTKENDFIEHLFIANTHSYLLFFTDKGKIYWKKVYYIPEGTRQARGRAIINLIDLDQNESVSAVIGVKEFDKEHYLMFATKNGIVKKTSLQDYSHPRVVGIKAIVLDQDDKVVNVVKTNNQKQLILATRNGQAVRFKEQDARPMGRVSRGVKGISLKPGDEVIGMVVASSRRTLMTITENGYGKRTAFEDYRLINRGGSGVRNIICSPRNGNVVGVRSVAEDDEVMVISKNGIIIRTQVSNINIIGRNTQGVRIMRLRPEDNVVSIAKILNENKEQIDDSENGEDMPQEESIPAPETVEMLKNIDEDDE